MLHNISINTFYSNGTVKWNGQQESTYTSLKTEVLIS